MKAFGASQIGLVRSVNEDAYYISSKHDVMVVADGMGGYVGGEIASRTAVNAVAYYCDQMKHSDTLSLQRAMQYANACVWSKTLIDPSLKGMGTTLTMVCVQKQHVYWGHMGDSRLYYWHDGALIQITSDHTWIQCLLAKKEITIAEAKVHPRRHVLTRAIGVDEDITPDTGDILVTPGDRMLLCTDGVTAYIEDEEMATLLGTPEMDEQTIVQTLLERVYAHGAEDNVTAIVLTI